MLQTIQIIGNLAADGQIKNSREGREFISFRVVVNNNSGDERQSTYFDVSCPKSNLIKYLKKGQLVYVSGKVTLSAVIHENKAYLNALVNAKDIELLGGNKDN